MSEIEQPAGPQGPGPEHALLDPFVGTFKAVVKLWMGPGDPMVMTGIMRTSWDLGGFFLSQSYVGDGAEPPFPNFEGRGFMGYNIADKRYEAVWLDTASTTIQNESGKVDETGKCWEMHGQMTNPQTGAPLSKRTVLSVQDADHHVMESYFATPDGESKSMEIVYERVS